MITSEKFKHLNLPDKINSSDGSNVARFLEY